MKTSSGAQSLDKKNNVNLKHSSGNGDWMPKDNLRDYCEPSRWMWNVKCNGFNCINCSFSLQGEKAQLWALPATLKVRYLAFMTFLIITIISLGLQSQWWTDWFLFRLEEEGEGRLGGSRRKWSLGYLIKIWGGQHKHFQVGRSWWQKYRERPEGPAPPK